MRRAACLAALLWLGCTRRPDRPVLLDLAADLASADREGTWTVIPFGTPSGIAAQFSGFFDAPLSSSGDSAAWLARVAEIGFRQAAIEPRAALLDLAPFPGLASQRVELFLNDEPIGGFGLTQARRRYRVSLPTRAQRQGVNRLRLVFAAVGPPQKPLRRRVAALGYGLALAPARDRALADLLSARAPAPISSDGGAITLAVAATLRFAFRAPPGGELRFTPALHPLAHAAGARAELRVILEEEGREPRTLWSKTVTAREHPAEVALSLGAAPGARVVLGLQRDASEARLAWGVFREPRVTGAGPRDPLLELPQPQPVDRRADALRASLAGANVVYVILDAAGARHFGVYGSPRATTPAIDRIAQEGVVFDDAASVATFTHLSMGSAWTSLLPDQHHNGVASDAPLPREPPTLAELLSAAGIHTAGFVSNGVAGGGFGLDRGFLEFEEVFKKRGAHAGAYRGFLPDWLASNAGRRFFLYLHFREPHFAYDPPPPFDTLFGPDKPLTKVQKTRYDWITDVNWKRQLPSAAQLDHLGRLYDGNLAYVDGEVGELRKAMERAGLWDRSLVIVSADHGDGLYEHEYIGHLDQVYEAQTRIPLILKFPRGQGPRGLRVPGLVDTLDIAPTILDAFQVAEPPTRVAFRGRSLLPAVLGAKAKAWSLARCAGVQPKYALRAGAMKLVYHTARDSAELYDLAVDPEERRDLAAVRPIEAAYYRQAVRRLVLAMRRGPRAHDTPEPALSAERQENLKALGYLP